LGVVYMWGKIYTLYTLTTYHMIKIRLLMQDNIVVLISDSTYTETRQILGSEIRLCMVIIDYLHSFKKYAVNERCTL
jgi:hypothetical protein